MSTVKRSRRAPGYEERNSTAKSLALVGLASGVLKFMAAVLNFVGKFFD